MSNPSPTSARDVYDPFGVFSDSKPSTNLSRRFLKGSNPPSRRSERRSRRRRREKKSPRRDVDSRCENFRDERLSDTPTMSGFEQDSYTSLPNINFNLLDQALKTVKDVSSSQKRRRNRSRSRDRLRSRSRSRSRRRRSRSPPFQRRRRSPSPLIRPMYTRRSRSQSIGDTDLRTILESRRQEANYGNDFDANESRDDDEVSLSNIYEEMEKTERLRREVEEEKLKLFQPSSPRSRHHFENEMPFFNDFRGADNPWTGPERPFTPAEESFAKKSEMLVNAQVPGRHAQGLGPSSERQEVIKPGNYLPSLETQVSHAQGPGPRRLEGHEAIKPGNYLLTYWNVETLGGKSKRGKFYQLGAFMPHGVGFQACVMPENCSEDELSTSGIFVKQNNRYLVKINHQNVPPISTNDALLRFLEFLEKGKASVRPQYDGVLLLSSLQEVIPAFLKLFKKHELWNRFKATVKGIGDLCTYMVACHMNKLFSAPSDKADLSISNVYHILFKQKTNFYQMSEKKSKATLEILETLLQARPSYSNFFKNYISPLEGKEVTRMVNYKSFEEKVQMFLPLQHFIAKELIEQQVELIMEGVYAPSEEDETKYLSQPQQVALTMCKILITSGFEFDRLIQLYQRVGLDEFELTLRTAFLDKMAGQPRPVVHQTIRTTRLVMVFFRLHGHRSVKDLTGDAIKLEQELKKQIETRESAKHFNATESKRTSPDQYQNNLKGFQEVGEYVYERLSRHTTIYLPGKSPTEMRAMADMMVNALIQANLSLDRLKNCYLQDFDDPQHLSLVRNQFSYMLEAPYSKYGPSEVKVTSFIQILLDFMSKTFQKKIEKRHLAKKKRPNSTQQSIPRLIPGSSTAMSSSQTRASLMPNGKNQAIPCPPSRPPNEDTRMKSSLIVPEGVPLVSAAAMADFDQEKGRAIEEARIKLDKAINDLARLHNGFMSDFRIRLFSLTGLRTYMVQKMEPMAGLCGGNVEHIHRIAEHVIRLLSYLGYNHQNLKQCFDISETNLVGGLVSTLRERPGYLPPGVTNGNIVDYVAGFFREKK